MKTLKIIIIVIISAGVIAAAAGYFFVYNKPHTNYEKAKPEIRLDAKTLYNDFIQDQEQAHQKYNGKVLEISGKLSDIEQHDDMLIAVLAFGDGMFGKEGVRCNMLNEHKDNLKLIEPESIITLKGYCTGFTGTDVILEHCSIIE